MTKTLDAVTPQILPAAYSLGYAQVRHASAHAIPDWASRPFTTAPLENAVASSDIEPSDAAAPASA
jgi:hypothetical protein